MNTEEKRGVTLDSISGETTKEKLDQLNKNIGLCKKYKGEIIRYVKKLEDQYQKGIFSYAEYEYLLNRYLKGAPLDRWVQHYESQEKKIQEKIRALNLQKHTLEKHLTVEETQKPKKQTPNYSLIAILLIMGITIPLAYYLYDTPENRITGLSISEIETAGQQYTIPVETTEQNKAPVIESYTPETGRTLYKSETETFKITATDPDNDALAIQWYINNLPVTDQTSDSLDYTATETGKFEIKALVTDLKDYSTHKWDISVQEKTAQPEQASPEETVTPEENITLPEENLPEIIPEENFTIPEETTPETEETTPSTASVTQLPAEINKPVQWIIRTKRTNEAYTAIELPIQARYIFVNEIITTPILEVKEIKKAVPKENITIQQGPLSMSLSAYELTDEGTTGFFIANVQNKGLLSTITDPLSFKFLLYKIFYKASLRIRNLPSQVWGSITEPALTPTAMAVKEEEKITLIINYDGEEFEINYETPEPKAVEEEEGDKKYVIVSSALEYSNVLAYTTVDEDKIISNIILLEDSTNVSYTRHDENTNGLTDKVSWTIPLLDEEQTYGITFEQILANYTWLLNETWFNETLNYTWPLNETWFNETLNYTWPLNETWFNETLNYTWLLNETWFNETLNYTWLLNETWFNETLNYTWLLNETWLNETLNYTETLINETLLNETESILNYTNETETILNYSYKMAIPASYLAYLINCPSRSCIAGMATGYLENYNYFCTVTNSRKTEPKGADLSASIDFDIANVPEQYGIAEFCLYASAVASSIAEEGIPKIHLKEEDKSLLQTAIEEEMDNLPLIEITNTAGWNCFDVTALLKGAQSDGKTIFKLRVAGQNLASKQNDQYACFRGMNSITDGCSEEEQQGMTPDCRPVLQVKWN